MPSQQCGLEKKYKFFDFSGYYVGESTWLSPLINLNLRLFCLDMGMEWTTMRCAAFFLFFSVGFRGQKCITSRQFVEKMCYFYF